MSTSFIQSHRQPLPKRPAEEDALVKVIKAQEATIFDLKGKLKQQTLHSQIHLSQEIAALKEQNS